MMRVRIETADELRPAAPELLFAGRYKSNPNVGGIHYDVSSDGERFLMIQSDPVVELQVVLGWLSEVEKRLAP